MKLFRTALLLLLTLAGAGADAAVMEIKTVMSGHPVSPPAATTSLQQFKLPDLKAGPATQVRLPAPSTEEIQALKKRNASSGPKRLQVALGRTLPPEAKRSLEAGSLAWRAVPGGGLAARFSITSTGAVAIRVGLRMQNMPAGFELRFRGSGNPTKIFGPYTASDVEGKDLYWSPVVEGETVTGELFIPVEVVPPGITFDVALVSHIMLSPVSGQLKDVADIGQSGSCNIDVACIPNPSPGLLHTITSVAKMIFTESDGSSYLCSGTLINDDDPQTNVPYFFSADHCISTQATAATLNTYWFFEATTCGSKIPRNFVQLTRGASLLENNTELDSSLLRLNESSPTGVWFAGWDATPVATGTSVIGIHHPSGDLKKISAGQSTGYAFVEGHANFLGVQWSSGTTEPGSSGSGVFVMNAGEYAFRGGLYGGASSCSMLTGEDYYSPFDKVYPLVRKYIAGSPMSLTGTPSGSLAALHLTVTVSPAEADLGLNGSIFVAALAGSQWYFLTPTGWNVFVGGPFPAYSTGVLSAQSIPVLDGTIDASGLIGTSIYAGYGTSTDDLLISHKYAVVYTVQ